MSDVSTGTVGRIPEDGDVLLATAQSQDPLGGSSCSQDESLEGNPITYFNSFESTAETILKESSANRLK